MPPAGFKSSIPGSDPRPRPRGHRVRRLRGLGTGISPRIPALLPRSARAGFFGGRAALGQIFLKVRFPLKVSFQQCSILIHSSITDAIYRVSQEEWTKLRESFPYVKLYRYNPKHLYPKMNGYGDNGHRKVWASGVSTYCKPSVTPYSSTAHARQRETTS